MKKAVLAAIVAALAVAPSASAVTKAQLQRQINAVNARVSAVEQGVASAVGQLNSRVASTERNVAAVNSRVATAERNIATLNQNISIVSDGSRCRDRITWDAIRIIAVHVGFRDPGGIDDGGSCARIGVQPYRALRDSLPATDALADLRADLSANFHHHRDGS
jgi:hypothetical protein